MTEGACTTRLTCLKELWSKSEADHFELLDDEEIDSKDNYFTTDIYSQMEEACLNNLGLFQDFLISLKSVTSSTSADSRPNLSAESFDLNQAKLPTISLPSFSGDIHEWINFRDTFNEMVLKRSNLPNTYKMHHLRSSLKDEADELLDGIPPAGKNFEDAWSTIKSFYDNPNLLINRLVNKLLSFDAMSANMAYEITRVHTGVKNLLKALKTLGSHVDTWDHITVNLTVSKLAPRLQAKSAETVSKQEDSTAHPTFDELGKYLNTERLSFTHLESAKSSTTGSNRDTKGNVSNSRLKNVKSFHTMQEHKNRTSSCVICKDTHLFGNAPHCFLKPPY